MSGGKRENKGVLITVAGLEMSDKTFESSLSSLAVLVAVWIIAGITLAFTGIRPANMDASLLIFLNILTGLIVLIVGGGTLLYFWGKDYMSRE
jgi:putative exporter of polyketide antibiotics